jgi:hypothetical protein
VGQKHPLEQTVMVNPQKGPVGLDSVWSPQRELLSNNGIPAKGSLERPTKTAAELRALLIWPVGKSPARSNSDLIIANFRSVTANVKSNVNFNPPHLRLKPLLKNLLPGSQEKALLPKLLVMTGIVANT